MKEKGWKYRREEIEKERKRKKERRK
jgi:hypothetical protein